MDLAQYVNVFQGSGEIDLPKPQGIAAKWFFIKAGCGNTTPAALVPFGKMSVCPYSGGYPTGYGNHLVNSFSRPKKFKEGKGLLGFAHLQQSGTGLIGYYYNYLLTTPSYGKIERITPTEETAKPGYYSCMLNEIKCELTADKEVAYHKYSFGSDNGQITIQLNSNGLTVPQCEAHKLTVKSVEFDSDSVAYVNIFCEGIDLYFSIATNGTITRSENNLIINNFCKVNYLQVAVSLKEYVKLNTLQDFDNIFSYKKENAYNQWNEQFTKIEIKPINQEINEIFYSNLYHSFVKPCDFTNESFIYSKDKPFMTDFATLWDMYKTQIPLILLTNKEIGNKICETLLSLGEALGYIPNNFGLTDKYKEHNTQARLLGAYVLMTAYRYGYDIDVNRMLKVIETDIFADDKKDFVIDGKCKSHTFMLDMADACGLCADIAKEQGNENLYTKLKPLRERWITCFDKNTGLLSADSEYYEGTLYNYSFRQMLDMEKRIELASGKVNFVKLLDNFFGYGAEDTVQATDPYNKQSVNEGMNLGRFEGFNNEPDMETPFTYILADRQDRTCEVMRYGLKYMFTTGNGGLPGNNDTGALSSFYILTSLGLLPVPGQDLFLIGSPIIKSAKVKLYNGNTLSIVANNNSDENIYVESVSFNGIEIKDFKIKATTLLQGGKLVFFMKKSI